MKQTKEQKKSIISKAFHITQSTEKTAELAGYTTRQGLEKFIKTNGGKVRKILVWNEGKTNE